MKLFYLFLAVVAATETTVAGVETTAVATVTESTVADVVETTAAATVPESTVADVETTASDVEDDNIEDQEDGEDDQEDDEDDPDDDEEKTDCAEVKAVIVRAKQGLEEQKLAEISEDPEIGADVWKWLENFCTEVCVAEGKNCDGIFNTACKESQSALKAASNETEKTSMKTACDLACADVEGETCGFLVNGLSFVLFAILAVFKY